MTWPTHIIVSPDLAPQPHFDCLRGSTHHLCSSTQPWGLGSTLTLQACFDWLLLLFICFSSTSASRKASENCLNSLHLLYRILWWCAVLMCVLVWVPVCGHHCTVRSVTGVIKIGIKEPGFATAGSRQIWLYKLEATKTCESFFLSFWFSVCLFLREGSNVHPLQALKLSTMALNLSLLTLPPEFWNYHTQLCSPWSLTQSL